MGSGTEASPQWVQTWELENCHPGRSDGNWPRHVLDRAQCSHPTVNMRLRPAAPAPPLLQRQQVDPKCTM
jgi:hypothetical protein